MPEPTTPPIVTGDPILKIDLPAANETLGLQFSVFGSCDSIGSNTSATVTVKVLDGVNVLDTASGSAVRYNPEVHTYEAMFNLKTGTSFPRNGSVVVSLDNTNFSESNAQLTIGSQNTLIIDAPKAQTDFTGWASGTVVASGTLAGCVGLKFWLRLTNAGNDVIGHQSWVVATDGPWSLDLGSIVSAARSQLPAGDSYNVTVSVWSNPNPPDQSHEMMRVSSGFFTVR